MPQTHPIRDNNDALLAYKPSGNPRLPPSAMSRSPSPFTPDPAAEDNREAAAQAMNLLTARHGQVASGAAQLFRLVLRPHEESSLLHSVTSPGAVAPEDVTHYVDSRRALIALHHLARLVLRRQMLVPGLMPLISALLKEGEPETTMAAELLLLSKYLAPLVVTFLLQYSLTVALVFSVGRLGKLELAAVLLALMTANITGYAIIQGVSTCLDTLCAQAFGRGDRRMVGVHFLRCTIFLLCLYVPIVFVWTIGAQWVLIRIIPERSLVLLAVRYLRVLSLGVPGFIVFENLKHFLQAQGIFHASTYVLVVCAPLNVFLNYLLVWDKRVGLGFVGAPLSVVIVNWLMAALLTGYTVFVQGHECWCGFTRDGFRNWSRMLSLAGPGVLMVEAEWAAFEIITLAALRFGTTVLAAQLVVNTTAALMYQVPFAILIAALTRIAWFVGAAAQPAAIVATRAAILLALLLGVVCALAIYLFRFHVAGLFTLEPEVIELAGLVFGLIFFYEILDYLTAVTGGVLRGQGRQKIGGYLNLIAYYCVAIPIAFLLAFHFKLQLYGLYIGMVIALTFVAVLQLYYINRSDWQAIINESIQEAILEQRDPAEPLLSPGLRPVVSRSRSARSVPSVVV